MLCSLRRKPTPFRMRNKLIIRNSKNFKVHFLQIVMEISPDVCFDIILFE